MDSQGHQVGCDTEREREVGREVNPLPRSRPPDEKGGALIRAGGKEGTTDFRFNFYLKYP